MGDKAVNAVLHIGAGKCGSSALQHALSLSPRLATVDGVFEYCAFGLRGKLLRGNTLSEAAQSSPFGYATCPTVPPLEHVAGFRRAGRSLKDMLATGASPILSNEGWIYSAEQFAGERLLEAMGLRPRVVAFVRPPIEWLNSAWWQWGAWTGAPLDRWIRNALTRSDWHQHLRAWSEVGGVVSVGAIVLGNDVVGQFHADLGAKPPVSRARYNTALPEGLLRFFQRNRAFRPGPHDSSIEFILARHLGSPDTTAPWVMTPELCRFVMDRLSPGIEALKPFLSQEDARRLDEDPAWRDPDHYRDRELAPADDPGNIAEADAVIAALIRQIIPDAGRDA